MGILTDPQAKTVFKALEARDDVEVLSAPEVTTLSGRQAQIQMVAFQTFVTVATPVVTNGVITNVLHTTNMPSGLKLDVIPYVAADGDTIQMTLIPSITQFLGYDDRGTSGLLPLPRFRVRQVTTTATVWDGQTIVIGGFAKENRTQLTDKVPILGNLPWIGELFRSKRSKRSSANATNEKNLIIFVTATIIDPAGNRMNSDADATNQMKAAPNRQPVLPGAAR